MAPGGVAALRYLGDIIVNLLAGWRQPILGHANYTVKNKYLQVKKEYMRAKQIFFGRYK